MWPLFAVACASIIYVARTWRSSAPSLRLLVLWVLVGFAELVVHDSGNERRYIMFIPALLGLATLHLVPTRQIYRLVHERGGRFRRLCTIGPLVAALSYLAVASLLRVFFLDQVRAGHLHTTVVFSASVAVAITIAWAGGAFDWPRARTRSLRFAVLLVVLLVPVSIDVLHFARWARTRQYKDYDASIELGRLLAPGTLVHGKLANGMSLENRIKPIFIGHGFGNYDDRLQRDDVRYILTYTSPGLGFESQAGSDMIQQLLNRYPERRVVATFDVNETGGPDRAALIDKSPGTTVRVPN
jgi:hypothetical protein